MAEDRYLPPEYQAGLDEAQLQQLLAAQLAKSQAPAPQGQMVSGLYVKPSNLQYLSGTVGNVMVGRQLAQAQALRQRVMQQYLRDQQRAKEQVVGVASPREQEIQGPPMEGENLGTETIPPNLLRAQRMAEASPFPEVQALAKSLQENREKNFAEAAKHSSTESIIEAARQGGVPDKLKPSTWSPLQIQSVPGVGVFGTSQSGQGGQQIQGIQRPQELPTQKWGRDEIAAELKTLREAKVNLSTVPRLQTGLQEAYKLVKTQPINAGALASEQTALQSLSRIFGIDTPTAVPVTQYVRSVLVPQLAEVLKAVRQSGSQSNAELKVAMERALDIDRDPRALEQMLVHAMRASVFAIQEHNQRVGQVEDLSPTAGVDPQFATIQRVPFKMSGFSDEEAQQIFPEFYGKAYSPAETLTRPPPAGPKTLQPKAFTPPGR